MHLGYRSHAPSPPVLVFACGCHSGHHVVQEAGQPDARPARWRLTGSGRPTANKPRASTDMTGYVGEPRALCGASAQCVCCRLDSGGWELVQPPARPEDRLAGRHADIPVISFPCAPPGNLSIHFPAHQHGSWPLRAVRNAAQSGNDSRAGSR